MYQEPSTKYQVFTLKNIPTDSFTMTALELKEYLDFAVKRVYFITAPTGEYKTGQHCHRAEEDELFVQIQGSSTIIVDDGHGLENIRLEGLSRPQADPQHAISIPHLVWHGFKDMSPDSIILALTNTNYDPSRSDYCEDYSEFQKLVINN